MKYLNRARFLVFLALGLIILDRLTKWLALDSELLFKNPKLYFIPLNSSLLYFLIGAVTLLLLFLFFRSWQKKDFLLITGFSLIILGGLSNLFDRIYFGYVIDWIKVFFLPISIFNIADLMIIGGIICLIFRLAKSR
ncbi:signal peptidase II [Patescibacteria group bacterium]|nr:signal peptidase II [Patescibacteria group bacterium]